MLSCFDYPYRRQEEMNDGWAVAVYQVYGAGYGDILKKAGNFAVGQTVGTWVKVPGITQEMVEGRQGRVLSLTETAGVNENEPVFILRLAFPLENIGGSLTMLMTALVGADVSTALHTRLMDIEWYDKTGIFNGPKQGMRELRELTGAQGRPVVLNMIKPCVGFAPEAGANFFYEAACGGLDLIKDDELLGSPSYNEVEKRVQAYLRAANSAFETSGKHTVYLPNITSGPKKMRENAQAAINSGAKACLVNFVFGGLDSLAELSEEFGEQLFIMAHYAGSSVMCGDGGGISQPVLLGVLARLAGAHAVMTPAPTGQNMKALYELHKTVQNQRLPIFGIAPVVTAVGGGITPINQWKLQQDLGKDIILGIGGAVQGHPSGATAGARAAMAAVEASAKGVPLEDAALDCTALKQAMKIWSA